MAKSTKRHDPWESAPPHNAGVEQLTLGCLIVSGAARDREVGWTLAFLSPEDFYVESHAALFAGLVDCWGRAVPFDADCLVQDFKDHGRWGDSTSGRIDSTLLFNVTMEAGFAWNLRYYSKILRDLRRRRDAMQLGLDLATAAQKTESTAWVESLQRKATALCLAIQMVDREAVPAPSTSPDAPAADTPSPSEEIQLPWTSTTAS